MTAVLWSVLEERRETRDTTPARAGAVSVRSLFRSSNEAFGHRDRFRARLRHPKLQFLDRLNTKKRTITATMISATHTSHEVPAFAGSPSAGAGAGAALAAVGTSVELLIALVVVSEVVLAAGAGAAEAGSADAVGAGAAGAAAMGERAPREPVSRRAWRPPLSSSSRGEDLP